MRVRAYTRTPTKQTYLHKQEDTHTLHAPPSLLTPTSGRKPSDNQSTPGCGTSCMHTQTHTHTHTTHNHAHACMHTLYCTCSLPKLVTWVSPGEGREEHKRNLGKGLNQAIEPPKRPTPPEIPKLWVDLQMISLAGSPHFRKWVRTRCRERIDRNRLSVLGANCSYPCPQCG